AMHALNPVRTVGEQIAEPLLIHHRSAPRARVADLLDQVELPARRANAYPHELSGGQKQRVMIAMALACEPRLIIADEPTTALDVTIQAQILHELADLCRETGTALILVTHDFGVVAELGDRVVVMYGGRIVEQASVTELF